MVDMVVITKIMIDGKLQPASFEYKEQAMRELVKKYNPYRVYVDQTGMGEKPVEDYKRLFGKDRVEGIIFNQPSMEQLAINAKQAFEDRKLRLPFTNSEIRSDLRLIKKEIGIGNRLKFKTEKDKNGHGDIA
jgi:phage FluMu gp28-like protein